MYFCLWKIASFQIESLVVGLAQSEAGSQTDDAKITQSHRIVKGKSNQKVLDTV